MIGEKSRHEAESRTKPVSRDVVPPKSLDYDGPPRFTDGLFVRPIMDADDLESLTFVRTMDARTSLARAMAEYLSLLSMQWEGGRDLKFVRTRYFWAEPEDDGKLPAAALIGREDAEYSEAYISPHLVQAADGTERYLRSHSSVFQKFDLEIWSTDPVELYGLVAMVEDALDPTEFMIGVRLELPYYFGQRATFLKTHIRYGQGGSDAQQRWRKAIFSVTGEVPQLVPVGVLKVMDPQFQLTVKDSLGD